MWSSSPVFAGAPLDEGCDRSAAVAAGVFQLCQFVSFFSFGYIYFVLIVCVLVFILILDFGIRATAIWVSFSWLVVCQPGSRQVPHRHRRRRC